jgi:putative ABC transport system permease protein
MPGGYAIRLPIPVPINEFTPVFAAVSGTKVASPIALFPAVLDDDGVRREVGMAAIDPTTFEDEGSLIMVEGDRGVAFEALRDGGAVLIPQSFAQREGLTVGSNVTLDLPGESAAGFEVAGIVAYSLPGRTGEASAIMSLEDAEALWGVTDASLWAMVRQPTITATAYQDLVAAAAADNAGEPLSAEQVADRLTRSLDQLIGLYDALALVAVLIGALGIVNTLSLAVSERVREIAILRAHGMTVGQVQAMVVAEASIMGLVGGLLAGVAGVLMAWAIVATSARADFAAGLVIPWPLLAVVALVGLGISALAGVYPARRAAKLSMVAGLKGYE